MSIKAYFLFQTEQLVDTIAQIHIRYSNSKTKGAFNEFDFP